MLTEEAKDYLLREGTDMRYGARHLKRAIDRSLAQPMSNLIATGQVCRGDLVKVAFNAGTSQMTFIKEAENMPALAMLQMMKASAPLPVRPVSVGAVGQIRAWQRGGGTSGRR